MKSLVNDLLHIASGVLKDVQMAYPEYRGVVKDKARLSLMAQTRGLGFFTLDLPALDNLLCAGLREGRLHLQGPATHAVSKKCRVPRLFRGLWLRVFEPNLCLRSDADPNAILFLRQLCCLGKKLEVGCSPARLKKAVDEYHEIDKALPSPTLAWETDSLEGISRCHSLHFSDRLEQGDDYFFGIQTGNGKNTYGNNLRLLCNRLQLIADNVSELLGTYDPLLFSENEHVQNRGIGLRHGPGAVAERTGAYDKYDFRHWTAKLDRIYPKGMFSRLNGRREQDPLKNHEVPSRLIAVPKTAKSPRLIAAEPSEHQWCQQALKRWFEHGFAEIFKGDHITLNDQSASQRMVLRASLKDDLATVDLSSASDRLSCWAVERMFRHNQSVLTALHASRTRWLKDSILDPKQPSYIKLKKFASQGTAVTFPVQSLFFWCCAMACLPGRDAEDRIKRYRHKVRVFGDDIILPKAGYADLVRLLDYLGLKVNVDKSFHKGHFRESCGMDAFKGYDVTPVKPKSIKSDGPTSRAAMIDFANNLFNKGLWHASVAAESTVKQRFFWNRLPIVGRECGATGRTSFMGGDVSHLRKRWCKFLHRWEVRAWAFRSRVRREPTSGYNALFQWFTEAPAPDTRWVHGYALKPKTSDGLRWVELPDSVLIAR
jgi:hypothetical protein